MARKPPLPIPSDIEQRLQDLDYKVRGVAVRELGDTRNLQAIDYLLTMMNDKTITVRGKVGQNLRKFLGKDDRVVLALILLTADVHGVHKWILRHLLVYLKKHHQASLTIVLEMVKHPKAEVRRTCLWLLWELEPEILFQTVPMVINDHSEAVQSFIRLLPKMFKDDQARQIQQMIDEAQAKKA